MNSEIFVPNIVDIVDFYGDVPDEPMDDDEPGLYDLSVIISDQKNEIREFFQVLIPNNAWLKLNNIQVSISKDFIWLERGFLFVRRPYFAAIENFIEEFFRSNQPYRDWDELIIKLNDKFLWEGSSESYPPRLPQSGFYD